MDHIVYLDAKAKEAEMIFAGTKTMIIRGAAGRKIPHGRVFENDVLYFVLNNASAKVFARAVVKKVINSEKLTPPESAKLIEDNQSKLRLTEKQLDRWSGKRYLVLIEIENPEELTPFAFNKGEFTNMDDWLPVEDINKVKL